MFKKLLPYLLIFLIGFVVYANSLNNAFVWDDEEQIVANQAVHSVSSVPSFFTGSTFNAAGGDTLLGMYYKPMMSTFFSLLYTIDGPNPFYFHLFQLMLHIANTCMLFWVFRFFLLRSKQISVNILSLGAALIFLVHPIQVEAVVYISALQDVLFFFFGMMALVYMIKQLDVSSPPPPIVIPAQAGIQNPKMPWIPSSEGMTDKPLKSFSMWTYITPPVLILLSLLSKETGIVWCFIIPLYVWLFRKDKIRPYIISVLTVFLLYLFLRFGVAHIGLLSYAIAPIGRASFITRIYTLPAIFWFYIKIFVFPLDLSIAYHWTIQNPGLMNFVLPFVAAVVVLGTMLMKLRGALFFFLWFLITMAIHMQIFPLDMTVAERWFYGPMAGLLGMLIILAGKSRRIIVITVIAIIIVILLSFRTSVRIKDWENGYTLFLHDITISKNAFDLTNNAGVELFRKGQFDKAQDYFEESTRLAPYWWTNWNNLGAIHQRKGDIMKAKELYRLAIINGKYYLAYQNYLGILLQQKQTAEAITFLEKEALPMYPQNEQFVQVYRYLMQYGKTPTVRF